MFSVSYSLDSVLLNYIIQITLLYYYTVLQFYCTTSVMFKYLQKWKKHFGSYRSQLN